MSETASVNTLSHILIVDDEQLILDSMEISLAANFRNPITTLLAGKNLNKVLSKNNIGVLLLDLIMPGKDGMQILTELRSDYPDLPIIIVTGRNEIETAVTCMRTGAFDYVVKPVDTDRLFASVRKALAYKELQWEYDTLKEKLFDDDLQSPQVFTPIITQSSKMKAIFKYLEAVGLTEKPVMITGETGVGKALIAQAIHDLSGRTGPYISENVSGYSEEIFADSLFGHTKGAYTGAMNDRKGLIDSAKKGTLFMDEIGNLKMDSQVKLLRLLQEGTFRPLGSDFEKRSEARVVAATNHNLEEQVQNGKFRKDLFYRFKTHRVTIPPLRERKEDLPLLLDHFIDKSCSELGKEKPTSPPELLTLLNSYDFPGNIRELEAMIFNAVSSHKRGVLSTETFKIDMGRKKDLPLESSLDFFVEIKGSFPRLKAMEEYLIKEALLRANNNLSIASGMLGISRQALSKRLTRKEEGEI